MKNEIKTRIEKLKEEINHYRYLYHVEDRQEISEEALDSLKNELFKLEQKYPELITPDSPTQRVEGKALDKFQKVQHKSQMFSLSDAFSREDMQDWEKRMLKMLLPSEKNDLDYFCELKLDGLAMSLRYKESKFVIGATRGDGKVGENVTQNLKTIESIPLNLRIPTKKELNRVLKSSEKVEEFLEKISKEEIEIRGEAIMSKRVFNELNKKYKKIGKSELANPRNGAAGSIRQLNPKLTAERKLDFYAYSLETDLGQIAQKEALQIVKLLGFKTLKENKYCKNLQAVYKMHEYWEDNREKLPMEIDGMVIKVNDLSLWKKLGMVGKGPRFMMAYKFSGEQVVTKLISVSWQVGRTGILTPTALLNPIKVGGVTVTHATLHNMDEINRLDLRIGDSVILERAGDVIPKIIQVLPNLRNGKETKISIPTHCPMCNSSVEKIPGEVAYKCKNKDCYAVNLRKLIHWTSKTALDIDGLGPKIIEQLMKEGLVADISDFYSLTEGDLKPLERFADKSATNLIKSISEKKEIDFNRFIYGLGIYHIGEESSIVLANKYKTLEKLQSAKLEDLASIYDFGEKMAYSVYNWFKDEKNIKLLSKLQENNVKIRKNELNIIEDENSEYSGKTFVVTGTLSRLTRDEAKGKIRELGAKVSSQVSKKTDFVLVGENPGSKAEKAKKLGIQILSEEEFAKIIN